jgi:MFS family permease
MFEVHRCEASTFLTQDRPNASLPTLLSISSADSTPSAIQSVHRVYRGWWVALAGALGLFLGPIPVGVFAFGVFLQPFAHEFHASRGDVSFARTLNSMILALGMPLAGHLADRFGARRVILPCTVVAGLVLLSALFISPRIGQLYLFYAAIGAMGCGTGPVTYCNAIVGWFDRSRGLALGLMMVGLGLGAMIMPSAAGLLTSRFGWRIAFASVGVLLLAISLPVQIALLRDTLPEQKAVRTTTRDPAPGFAESLSGIAAGLRDAFTARAFWLLLGSCTLVSASVTAIFAHIPSILIDRGASVQAAAAVASTFGAGLLIGRTALGYLLDRFFAPRIAALIFVFAAAGIFTLRVHGSADLAFSAAFLIGLGLGAEVDIMAYLTSRYFGLHSFGIVYGILFAAFGLAGGLGTYLMGAAFDATGSYSRALSLFCIATLIGAALMLALGPYRYQSGRR